MIILVQIIKKIDLIKVILKKAYKTNDLKEFSYYLGFDFVRDSNNYIITMNQNKYIEEVVKQFNIKECKPIAILSNANLKFVKLRDEMQSILYKMAIDSFMYMVVTTKMDLVFDVRIMSQHMSKSSSLHWTMVKRIMMKLKAMKDFELCIANKNIDL